MLRTTGIYHPGKTGKEVAMPTQSLPDNPSLENLRKQAKSLRKAVKANEPGALARVREFHPHPDEVSKDFALRDAQLVIARNYAFSSWAKLKQHLEVLTEYSWSVPPELPHDDPKTIADQFINLACLTYGGDHTSRRDKARDLFAANPSIGSESTYAAATVGDFAQLQRMLNENSSLATTRGGPRNWEPLLYATYSRFNSEPPNHSTLEVARLLLEHGADPNAGFLWEGHYLFTALTGAFGEGESGPLHQPEHQYCYELARMLLVAGADPNDSQTLYNRMFTGGTKHLELLFEFGLGKGSGGIWFKRLGDQGSPAEMLQQQMGWAAKYNQMARLQLLVEYGVDVNVADSRLRRTPYELALLNGNKEIAQYLLDHGAQETSLDDLDAFFSACLAADGVQARSLLAKDATLVDRLGDQRAELLQLAAERDKRDAIRLMADLNFDFNTIKRTTALHNAAMSGNLEMVKLLIELGANPRLRDWEFNATPLGWAEYGEKTDVTEFLRQFEPRPE
jgi:ankyrin repeat protein